MAIGLAVYDLFGQNCYLNLSISLHNNSQVLMVSSAPQSEIFYLLGSEVHLQGPQHHIGIPFCGLILFI